MTTQGERIAAVEVRIKSLEDKVESMDAKLDELLTLKYKGQGAFWLATGLFGTGIAAFFLQVLAWFRS
jgi:hypothetical protein